jgi:TPR repeat protein
MAAEKGNPLAQYGLGNLAAKGQGMRRDYAQAYAWFAIAASRFTDAESDLREQATKSRDDAAAKLNPADLAEAQKRVREWMPK